MSDFFERAGRVWIASSNWTEKANANLERAVEAGATTLVLKSVTPLGRPKESGGSRLILKGKAPSPTFPDRYWPTFKMEPPGPGEALPPISRSVYCKSDKKDLEVLTVEEANTLYDHIKENFPQVQVVQSLAPRFQHHFDLVDQLRADAFEISTRSYNMDIQKPVYFGVNNVSEASDEYENTQQYFREQLRKMKELGESFEELESAVPVLIKLSRDPHELPLNPQLEWRCDGFTYADSRKLSAYVGMGDHGAEWWGRGSICGEPLYLDTLRFTQMLRRDFPDKHLSASGGIMDPHDAENLIRVGADSVQLCSTIFYGGFDSVRKISDHLGNSPTSPYSFEQYQQVVLSRMHEDEIVD